MANKEVTFYTHPSTYLHANAAPSPCYDRIAGIMIDDETLWSAPIVLPEESSYNPTDTESMTIQLPESLANATAGYFRDFYADPPHLYRVSNPWSRHLDQSNCHRFGVSLWLDRPQTFLGAISVASEIISKGQRLLDHTTLPVGQLAVIGTIDPAHNARGFAASYAHHTMLSVGEGRYLQVMTFAGNMGISRSTEPSLAHYQGAQHPAADIYHSQRIAPPAPDLDFGDNVRCSLNLI